MRVWVQPTVFSETGERVTCAPLSQGSVTVKSPTVGEAGNGSQPKSAEERDVLIVGVSGVTTEIPPLLVPAHPFPSVTETETV